MITVFRLVAEVSARADAAVMQGVPREIVERQLVRFRRADPAYGVGVARARGLEAGRSAAKRLRP